MATFQSTVDDIDPAHREDDRLEPNRFSAPDTDDLRIHLLAGSTDTQASFEFINEGHTLGNALKTMILKNPQVELCAYTVPHPAERKMRIRIQMYEGGNVYEALEKGLSDLMELCDIVTSKFARARDSFMDNGGRKVNGRS